jgi:hypothetical protein
MCRTSVFCFTLAITVLAAVPLSAQLPPSPSSPSCHSSTGCSSGIAGVDLIVSELADEPKSGAAVLILEIARNMMNEGDFKGCATYVANAMRALKVQRVAPGTGQYQHERRGGQLVETAKSSNFLEHAAV